MNSNKNKSVDSQFLVNKLHFVYLHDMKVVTLKIVRVVTIVTLNVVYDEMITRILIKTKK